MDAEQVIEKILSDAKAEADKIKKQAQERQSAQAAKFDEQLAEYKKQTQQLAQKAAYDRKLHLLSAAKIEIAKQLLAEKRKILDEVFTQARQQLQNLPDEQYRQLIIKLMLKAVETGDEEVIVDHNEKRIDQKLIDEVNEQLTHKFAQDKGLGNKADLKLSNQRQNLGGGFILKRGKIKTNVSFEALLAQARRELEIQLAKELFEN